MSWPRSSALMALTAVLTVCMHGSDPLAAQEPTAPVYSLKVKAQEVVLDVVVTNKQGRIVENLPGSAFTVYEDKVPQVLRSLQTPASHLGPPSLAIHSTAELDRLVPDLPVAIIVLDEINSRFEDEAFARYSLRKFLSTQGDTLSQPTMLVAIDLQRVTSLTDYTTSRQQLLDALEHHFTVYPWHLSRGDNQSGQVNASFAALLELAKATSGHPGHKSVIWIGRGFPELDLSSLPPEPRKALESSIDQCVNALRAARVVLYTLDPAGISGIPTSVDEDGFYEGDPFGGQVEFNTMARASGGRSFYGRNDVDQLIAESTRDGNSFYTLSYTPKGLQTGVPGFHSVRVVMKDPSLLATTRSGYYTMPTSDVGSPVANAAPTAAVQTKKESTTTKNFDLALASGTTMIYDEVPLTAARLPGQPNTFKLVFSPNSFDWQESSPGTVSSSVTVVIQSFDKSGRLLRHTAETSTFQVSENISTHLPLSANIALLETFPTTPPAVRIRFVVRADNSGKLGSANVPLLTAPVNKR